MDGVIVRFPRRACHRPVSAASCTRPPICACVFAPSHPPGAQTGAPQAVDATPRSVASVVVSVVQQPAVKATLLTGGSVLLATFLFSLYKGTPKEDRASSVATS